MMGRPSVTFTPVLKATNLNGAVALFIRIIDSVSLTSNAKVFIILSSVKAVADEVDGVLTEEYIPNPTTHYGKSKLMAEQYILSKEIPEGKRVYILRPCMIHGPGNKGNLNLLYNYCNKYSFWPLGAYDNRRSFCTISNLCFIIDEFIKRQDIPLGIYNVADDKPISTNELVKLIGQKLNKKIHLLNIPKSFFSITLNLVSLLGLNSSKVRFQKLTENFVVSNSKLKSALGKELPVSADEGIKNTLESFE
jgi:nucleoside-diphosphate-sugar epimerase